jgi:hypothetical protein
MVRPRLSDDEENKKDNDLRDSIKITKGNHNYHYQLFQQYLLQRMNPKTAGDRMRYAKQFYNVLETGDAQPLLQLKPDKRIHAMKGLASLSRFLGCYDNWLALRRRYNLTWSTGNESLATFERFFDDSRTLDSMLQWVREAIQVLPPHLGEIIRFNVLTGLRPNETITAVRLINNPETFKTLYNEERGTLEHFRFPSLFLRRTKFAYVSIVNKEILGIVQNIANTPTYEAIRFASTRKGLSFHMGYCRKIFGSWLRQSAGGGIESETVDLLQGRVPRSVFARHYFTPSRQYRHKVLKSLEKLEQEI